MERIGSIGQVATQILDCASQRTKGIQRQRLLFWIPAIAPLLFIGAQWQSYASISHLFWTLLIPLTLVFILCGLAFGQGIFMAKRLEWKPLTAAYLLASIILIPIYYSGSRGSETMDGMSKTEVTAFLGRYNQMGSKLRRDTQAINQIIGMSKKPFEQRYAMAAPVIENSRTNQFSIDPLSDGTYLEPISIKSINDKLTPFQLQLGRTNSPAEAIRSWENLGTEFSAAIAGRTNDIEKYRFFLNSKPWPLWYVVYGSFLVPLTFLAAFGACAALAMMGFRIWIMRGSWLTLQKR